MNFKEGLENLGVYGIGEKMESKGVKMESKMGEKGVRNLGCHLVRKIK